MQTAIVIGMVAARQRPLRFRLPVAVAVLSMATASLHAAWPAARGGNGRTSWSAEGPGAQLDVRWSIETGRPAAAWSGEARGSLWQKIEQTFVPRAADDMAPIPILAGDAVIFGTTLDEVRCVDRATGVSRWSYLARAPVRFAPAVSEGKVLVGSDDGTVRALDLGSGSILWESRLGPAEPWIVGNGRLVSPHPVRTGLLVTDGVVYATAGLFPIEGTYLVALDAADGSLRWQRDLGNTSPQGYLVEAGEDLIVPQGRAAPKLYRKADGTFRRNLDSANGTLAVAMGDETYAGPGATGSFAVARPGARIVSFPGRHLAVSPAISFLASDRELLALDREILRTDRSDFARALRWKRPAAGAGALIVAGSHAYVGLSNGVAPFHATTGEPGPVLPVPSPVAALAADRELLVAVTVDGRIHAFGPRSTPGNVPISSAAAGGPNSPQQSPSMLGLSNRTTPEVLAKALDRIALRRGWALGSGSDDLRNVAPAWIVTTELSWVFAVEPSAAPALRRFLADQGWLGHRASVLERGSDGSVPAADHIFNLVIGDGLTTAEAERLVCPAPSGAIVRGGQIAHLVPGPNVGRWTHQYGDSANTCATRQSLAGDPRLRWFGGHGPELMPDRHTRGHAPLVAGGLIVSVAEDALIATDARNGTVRWTVATPGAMRYAMPYDAGHIVLTDDGGRVWCAVGPSLWEIDTRDGRVRNRLPAPEAALHWGWVAEGPDGLFGSLLRPTAPRTRKEYDLVDADYRSGRPLVCSLALVRVDPATGQSAWIAPAAGAWVNPTLAMADGRVFGVEARGARARSDGIGRLTCQAILEDARVVCLEAVTGRRLWERPLEWPQAEDILGLAVRDGRLFLSCARSAGKQAAYHLRCWDAGDGSERWQASGLNPIEDLFHGQQVKRPVVMAGRVSFESDIFDAATGSRWVPPGGGPDWILSRPGHACGGMTGTDDGLLFRADNPTYFRFADGSFTRLSPTRPGCWLNILPVEGGVVIPEASASCICGYPIQASLGFGFGSRPANRLQDSAPVAER